MLTWQEHSGSPASVYSLLARLFTSAATVLSMMRISLLGTRLSETLQLSQPAGLDAAMRTQTLGASLTSADSKMRRCNNLLDIPS